MKLNMNLIAAYYGMILICCLSGCTDDGLHRAVATDDIVLAQKMIGQGNKINGRDRWYGNTPLHYVVNIDVAKMLIQQGADVNAKNKLGDTPLHYVVTFGNDQVVDLLIQVGADINATNQHGEIPLHWSVIDETPFSHFRELSPLFKGRRSFNPGKGKIIERFLQKGVSPNARTITGETPLHYAAMYHIKNHSKDIVELLLQHGADPVAQDINGRTPLGDQYSRPKKEILQILQAAQTKSP